MKKEKTPVAAEPNPAAEENKENKKVSKLKILSILWTLATFAIYIALDANKIVKNGWTAVNIIVTVFLGLQIALFLVFTAIGTKSKEDGKKQKATLKWVKKAKKLTLKLTTVVTSVLMIINVEKVSFSDVLAVVVAVISLVLVLLSLAIAIKKQIKKSKKQKAKRAKQEKKEN